MLCLLFDGQSFIFLKTLKLFLKIRSFKCMDIKMYQIKSKIQKNKHTIDLQRFNSHPVVQLHFMKRAWSELKRTEGHKRKQIFNPVYIYESKLSISR